MEKHGPISENINPRGYLHILALSLHNNNNNEDYSQSVKTETSQGEEERNCLVFRKTLRMYPVFS